MSWFESLLKQAGKPFGRTKVGMLLLVLVPAALLSFISAMSKDAVTRASPEIWQGFRNHFQNIVNPNLFYNFRPALTPKKENKIYTDSDLSQQPASNRSVGQAPAPFFHSSRTFARHPCESFSFAPPPMDKKRRGPRPCLVCYVPIEQALTLMPSLPSPSPILKKLSYIVEAQLVANDTNGGSLFGGFSSLLQRDESFHIKESMHIHCGFVKGERPGQGTGFDLDEADLVEMEECRGVLVASAIFGNYDIVQQPKNTSEYAKRSVCFYMFVDKETEDSIKNYTSLDSTKRAGLWKVVVVQNLPYEDPRRNGKVPKLLLHRLFPNVRYSIWIDGKLELIVDPYQILERFLWRTNSTFAISRHYRRFDVFEEAEANKVAGRYDNASIDHQIEFYKKEGLTHYSSAKLPITSDVPEGCVIIKEHTPIANLFTCLWFNEVDRFTSRDQLSFSTVRDKIMSKVNWIPNMFMDCERRNFVVQAYHRHVLEEKQKALSSLRSVTPRSPHQSHKHTILGPPVGIARAPPPAFELPRKVAMNHRKGSASGSTHR